ncbi:hypothetical protein PND67_16945, partial [Flavonifractor plautii]|nr:hypothetical protein [Flavonifractor plautii]
MKSIYQLTALIGNKSDGINDEKFMTAAWILYAWMRREVIDCIPLPELPATVSKSAKTGRSVASIYQPEEHFYNPPFCERHRRGYETQVLSPEIDVC